MKTLLSVKTFLVLCSHALCMATGQVQSNVPMEFRNQLIWSSNPSNQQPTPNQTTTGVLRITLKNLSKHAALSTPIQQFLMPHQIYVSSNANPNHPVEFSFDGGHTFFKEPMVRTVEVLAPQGWVFRKIKVLPEEYTDVRWNIQNLPAGAEVTLDVLFKVK